MFWVLEVFLLSVCDSPPSRSANRRGYFGGAIRREVWNAFVSFGFGGFLGF